MFFVMLPASQLSCDQLGWAPKPATPEVCSSSTIRGECSAPLAFSAALSHCGSVGARLCTQEELEEDVAVGSGCDLDFVRTWSSTLCANDEIVTTAGSVAAAATHPSKCIASSKKFLVRCCADTNTGRWEEKKEGGGGRK